MMKEKIDLEFGAPVNVNGILRLHDIEFQYDGLAGGFHYYTFKDKTNYHQAIKLIENIFISKIKIDPDWIEWRT